MLPQTRWRRSSDSLLSYARDAAFRFRSVRETRLSQFAISEASDTEVDPNRVPLTSRVTVAGTMGAH